MAQENPTPSTPPPPSQNERIVAAIQCLQDELESLRVVVKYMAFDLDCTRRERDEAKRTAENWHRKAGRMCQEVFRLRAKLKSKE
ncbi:MAG: hypothetical protein IT435_02640 [Phycisphaerales bacterium]|nr:hypothetical protein [Phycisphaerales bacterium]